MWGLISDPYCLTFLLYIRKTLDGNDCLKIKKKNFCEEFRNKKLCRALSCQMVQFPKMWELKFVDMSLQMVKLLKFK